MKNFKNYINGKYVNAIGKKTFKSINPADTTNILGVFPRSSKADIDLAVLSAQKAYQSWSKLPAPKRGEFLQRIGNILRQKKKLLAKIMTQEMGKPIAETLSDVQEAIDTAFYAAGESRRLFGYTTPSELTDKICITIRKSIGVCGIITPWNFPIAIPAWKIFPAITCGNTVVFKPAEDTPLSASKLMDVLIEAGLPKGVVNMVCGFGEEAGEALVKHPDVKLISFSGSVEVGKLISKLSADTVKKVSLELGGKNAQIVMDDANIDLAVEGALWGAFATSGQRCTSTSRLILHKTIKDDFLKKFLKKTKKIKIGPIINKKQLLNIDKYVRMGIQEGAELLTGGKINKKNGYLKGYFYEPTVFINVLPDMTIAKEEIFGPVVIVMEIDNLKQAIDIINNTNYGLSSSIYTRDITNVHKAIDDIEAGITYINGPTIGAEAHLPFGGVKQTGNGHREGGKEVYDIFTEWKTVYIDYSGHLQKAQID